MHGAAHLFTLSANIRTFFRDSIVIHQSSAFSIIFEKTVNINTLIAENTPS